VAQLAGVPRGVIAEARRYLEHLEAERDRQRAAAPGVAGGAAQTELPLFAAAGRRGGESAGERADALREALSGIDPDGLSPREALETLYRLRRLLGA
jgi:DNA mismatch repair protein MutS